MKMFWYPFFMMAVLNGNINPASSGDTQDTITRKFQKLSRLIHEIGSTPEHYWLQNSWALQETEPGPLAWQVHTHTHTHKNLEHCSVVCHSNFAYSTVCSFIILDSRMAEHDDESTIWGMNTIQEAENINQHRTRTVNYHMLMEILRMRFEVSRMIKWLIVLQWLQNIQRTLWNVHS